MPNPNYARGTALERLVCERLEMLGWLTVRAAGSHGPADVWAAKPNEFHEPRLLLVQCKAGIEGRIRGVERDALVVTAHGVGAIPVLATSRPGEGLRFRRLDTDELMF